MAEGGESPSSENQEISQLKKDYEKKIVAQHEDDDFLTVRNLNRVLVCALEKIVIMERKLSELAEKSVVDSLVLQVGKLDNLKRHTQRNYLDPGKRNSFVWKISDYSLFKKSAETTENFYIESPQIYTHPSGYKLCFRAYLNGDGLGKGKFLSIFVQILKGDYDALLRWPFAHKITIIILPQSVNGKEIKDAFHPLGTSSDRPTTEGNIPQGIACFISHKDLEDPKNELLKSDTLFIRFIINDDPYPFLYLDA